GAQSVKDRFVYQQMIDLVELVVVGIELPERGCDLDPKFRTVERVAVHHQQRDAMAELACVGIRRGRCETDGHKPDAGKQTRVERAGEGAGIYPWCAKQFKGCIGAAADGDITGLDETEAGVQFSCALTA